jgi:hypothetical protein
MCPQRFVPQSYDADKLRLLQQVFDGTWDLIELTYPNRDLSKDEEVRTKLAKEIVTQATAGASEPEMLCKLALKRLRVAGLLR